jgi:hypothetical protein
MTRRIVKTARSILSDRRVKARETARAWGRAGDRAVENASGVGIGGRNSAPRITSSASPGRICRAGAVSGLDSQNIQGSTIVFCLWEPL